MKGLLQAIMGWDSTKLEEGIKITRDKSAE
jgi:hypothetical protein